jgi:hypothetical protein
MPMTPAPQQAASRSASPGYTAPGQAARDAQDQAAARGDAGAEYHQAQGGREE